ncbi:MAG: isoleucine--tRNA ligase [Planctomycetaceae bacterium]|nr:isoleucine--tRNA ligase [Planctomycetaceae bacterium]
MSDPTAKPKSFKDTLNLPATSFPMRANLAQNEAASIKRWDDEGLYAAIEDARADAPVFRFHDGPPYANGAIHVGHLLNKVLKDIVVRARLLEGMRCPYTPGWDCHGLPIEHRVMTQLHEKGKAAKLAGLDEDVRRVAIRRECATYAEKFIKLQSGQMKRLLTLADYENPYLTMDPVFEARTLEVFAEMVEQGVVYRDLKPVHWSIENRTALAEAELEYEDREDPQVFVDFEASDREAVAKAFDVELDTTPSFMIWTTTPWTLPANLAIAVGPRYRYALARLDGQETVIARELLEAVVEQCGIEEVEVLAECSGAELLGLEYRHPFIERTGRILEADYVTLEDGTGLVHTAPGHGQEDYRTGQREGLEVYCPVQGDGTYDDTVPEWLVGKTIWEGNEIIAARLQESGHLAYHEMFTHSYPHDWRSKTPVIFRSTEQWFVAVDRPTKRDQKSLRNLAMDATREDVSFIPEWGRNRMRGMLESRPDWCLSRQRAWGLPIPAFEAPDGSVVLTPASVRAVAAVVEKRGSDAWFTESPADLLAEWDIAADPDAPEGVDLASLSKMHDIFDVWFESGSSWAAVMRARGQGIPADLYLEGSDQHRGWFQLSLLPALGATGEAPYRTLLTHGFMVDKDGRKMSKSSGNALVVDDLLKDFGADVCRWWVSSLPFENDIKVDMDFFKVAGESYRKIRNTLRFLLGNLSDFEAVTHAVPVAEIDPASIDGWVLAEAVRVEQGVRLAYREYRFRDAHQMIYDFCNDTLSAVYLVATKDRLYCDLGDSHRRRRTQTVMHSLAELLCRLLAPILPHTADEAYRSMHGDDVTIQMQGPLDLSYECDHEWSAVLNLREAALKRLEEAKAQGLDNPLDAGLVIPDPEGTFERFADELADACGVSRARMVRELGEVEIEDLREEPRCERSRKRDGTVRERSDGSLLSDRDAAAIGLA